MATRYSQEFKDQAIKKALQRGDQTLQTVADELNLKLFTLKDWLRIYNSTMKNTSNTKRPADWTRAERFQSLLDSAALEGEALHAFCRKSGIFSHHLETWKKEFVEDNHSNKSSNNKALQDEVKSLTKELHRKEKALAEAAALLVLQKKCQALWEEKV